MNGGADAQPAPRQRADVLERQRGAGALHGVGARGERDVDAVVDDQQRTALARGRAQAATQHGEVGGREVLLAHLDGGKTGGEAFAHDGDEVTAAGLATIGDEAESQLVQSGRPSSGEDAVA